MAACVLSRPRLSFARQRQSSRPQGEGRLLSPRPCWGAELAGETQVRKRLGCPQVAVRNPSRPALLTYANLAGVTRLPYGGALTLDALT